MPKKSGEHTLEFLLGFNGHVHRYAGGYWLKFEITKVEANYGRPHGLDYSFTLHGPDNRRLIGFDNAHRVPAKGAVQEAPQSDGSLASNGNRRGPPLCVYRRRNIA